MYMSTGDQDQAKTTRDEYLKALEEANQDYQDDKDEGEGFGSEAERLAALADTPKIRVDGKPMGSEDRKQPRKLDRKSTRLNSSHVALSRMPSSA